MAVRARVGVGVRVKGLGFGSAVRVRVELGSWSVSAVRVIRAQVRLVVECNCALSSTSFSAEDAHAELFIIHFKQSHACDPRLTKFICKYTAIYFWS